MIYLYFPFNKKGKQPFNKRVTTHFQAFSLVSSSKKKTIRKQQQKLDWVKLNWCRHPFSLVPERLSLLAQKCIWRQVPWSNHLFLWLCQSIGTSRITFKSFVLNECLKKTIMTKAFTYILPDIDISFICCCVPHLVMHMKSN